MAEYRKKPIVVEAFKWTGGQDQTEDPEWIVDCLWSGKVAIKTDREDFSIQGNLGHKVVGVRMEIETLEGTMIAHPGDYIIKGIQGEIYPCKPDIFEQTYEKVGV